MIVNYGGIVLISFVSWYHERFVWHSLDEMFQINTEYSLEGGGSSFLGSHSLMRHMFMIAIGYVFKVHKIEGRCEARD